MNEQLLENTIEDEIIMEKKHNRFLPLFARAIFIIFFAFMFIGNSLPFAERAKNTDEIITSNIVNQIAFPFFFLASIILLVPKMKQAAAILYKEKLFAIFLLWGLATVIWSNYPFVSFKRWFQVVIPVLITISSGLYIKDQDELFRLLKYVLFPYLLISVLSVILVPAAKDENGAWRALSSSKNNLGQESVINLIISTVILFISDYKDKIIATIMIMMCLVLLAGSQSVTSMSALLFIVFLGLLTLGDKYLRPLKLGRILTVLGLLTFAGILVSALVFSPEVLQSLAGGAGKDLTFTGRTNLWRDILHEANKHFLYGAGFQGYWVVENTKLQALYRIYIWLPNQAHNGYLDILNETGLIGLLLFFFAVIKYAANLKKLRSPNYASWFVAVILIINLQESTIIRPAHLLGVVFIFAYYLLFTGIYRQERREHNTAHMEYEDDLPGNYSNRIRRL
jgi:O-antigen ligase